MFLKLMLKIVEVLNNVLVLISRVAALNWSDTIYSNLGYPHKKQRKLTFFERNVIWGTLDIDDVPETDVENSCDPKQRFGINHPSGRAELTWNQIPNLRVPSSKNARNRYFRHENRSLRILSISDVPETYIKNSWSHKQSCGTNHPSGRAQLKWHHIF